VGVTSVIPKVPAADWHSFTLPAAARAWGEVWIKKTRYSGE
tara:strand:+ start:3182 stop:3304 length:123 start_codon:yes stop_codon:yes gene_type:complete